MSRERDIISEPIKVICINGKCSIKLIQNATYIATDLSTFRDKRSINIKGVGYFKSDYFTLLDGASLSNLKDFELNTSKILDSANKIYTGQFIRCKRSTNKSVKSGELYYVEDQKLTYYKSSYNGKSYPEYKIKLRGIDRYLMSTNFEEVPISEQRNIKLKNLNGIKTPTGEQYRKFLHYSEKEKISILLQLLNKVLIDILSVVDIKDKFNLTELMIEKGKRYDIIKDDINLFLTPEMKNILKPYDLKF